MINATTGEQYQTSQFAKGLFASESKVGKSCFLVASALGVLPWQKHGGIVDSPSNLHVITFDANALGGIQRFLLDTCKAPKEALQFKVYNLQDSMRRVSMAQSDYDMTFYHEIMSVVNKLEQTARGVPVLHFSSLTGAANGLERSIVGPPKGKGYSDMSKWKMIAHQLHELQNFAQIDKWHCFWEAHIDKVVSASQGSNSVDVNKESIRVSGEAGRNWAYNVEQVFRIRRQYGQVFPGTKCDQVYMDTRPTLDFISSGRNFTEALEPKEVDMTHSFMKLGLKVGNWGMKKLAVKKEI